MKHMRFNSIKYTETSKTNPTFGSQVSANTNLILSKLQHPKPTKCLSKVQATTIKSPFLNTKHY